MEKTKLPYKLEHFGLEINLVNLSERFPDEKPEYRIEFSMVKDLLSNGEGANCQIKTTTMMYSKGSCDRVIEMLQRCKEFLQS